ncbi:MAG: metal ABC transporter permease, partial [Defluviitaleaceae bacterium]|nr:metal ABC transporter permease [Defluviitaleaceae bacterium]
PVMLVLSTTIGTVASFIGMFFSITFNFPAGASIVLTLAIIFTLALIFAPKKGLIFQIKNNSNV